MDSSTDSTHRPEVVLEGTEPCRDGAATSAELDASLSRTSAPGAAWKVRVHFEARPGHVAAYGEVLDAHDTSVAKRTLTSAGSQCASLARGIGVWASLILDAELAEQRRGPTTAAANEPATGSRGLPPTAAASVAPTTSPTEPPSPEAELFLRHEKDQRTVEFGLEGFLMGGTGGGAILGPSLYGIFEAAHGFFLRPSVLVGHSIGGLTASSEAPATFLDSRFDACARLPGLYLEHRGLQLDLCAGGELGFSRLDAGDVAQTTSGPTPSRTLPFLAVGPSFGLRGEFGSNLSAIVRGITDLSLLRDEVRLTGGSRVEPPVFAGRAEVGLSWSLR